MMAGRGFRQMANELDLGSLLRIQLLVRFFVFYVSVPGLLLRA